MKLVPQSKRQRAALEYAGFALTCLAGGLLAGVSASDELSRLVLIALGLAGCALNGADAARLLAVSRTRS